nr:putative Peroxidase 48 [Ipomoea batatas]
MDFKRHLFLVFTIVVLIICLKNQNAETNKNHSSSSEFEMLNWSSSDEQSLSASLFSFTGNNVEAPKHSESLRYDYYDETCPQAEHIVQSVVRRLYMTRPRIAPQLLRLVFHDCFVQGCDASVLLDPADGIESEKAAIPNLFLKGDDVIDIIKSELEAACPQVVSCADIVVLAARESVILVGGPFYPLTTGRRDSNEPHLQFTNELPAPTDDLPKILEKFSSKGFKEWEIVSLLGRDLSFFWSHSTGVIHCNFFSDRLGRTNEPDPSIDTEFLNLLRSKCNVSEASSALPASGSAPVPSNEQPTIEMDYKGPGNGFGTIYYQSLLQSKGILFSDQQMIAAEETAAWVQAYALDVNLFRLKFCRSMMKLSNLGVLTASKGRVRLNCRKVH